MPFARFPMSDGAQWQTFEASAFFELKTVMSVLQYSFLHDAAKVQKANEFPKLFPRKLTNIYYFWLKEQKKGKSSCRFIIFN